MKLNSRSLRSAAKQLANNAQALETQSTNVIAPVSYALSPVIGLSEAGAIHGRALAGDPSSAQRKLLEMGRRIGSIAKKLHDSADAVEEQDGDNAFGLDIADAGGEGTTGAIITGALPPVNGDPLMFLEPVVNVGPSIHSLATALAASRPEQLVTASTTWTTIATEVGLLNTKLEGVAQSLELENDAEPVTQAVVALREIAALGVNLAGHATYMANQASGLAGVIGSAAIETAVMAQSHAVSMGVGAGAAAAGAEQAMLVLQQQRLQAALAMFLPHHSALTDPLPSRGGGAVETGRDEVEGEGEQYNTNNVQWPKKIVEAVLDGRIGPGSFEMVNGKVTGLNGVGDFAPAEVRQTVDSANSFNTDMLRKIGSQALEATQVGTQAAGFSPGGSGLASVTAHTAAPSVSAGPSPVSVTATGAPGGAGGAMPVSAVSAGSAAGPVPVSATSASRVGTPGVHGVPGGAVPGASAGPSQANTSRPGSAGAGAMPVGGAPVAGGGAARQNTAGSRGTAPQLRPVVIQGSARGAHGTRQAAAAASRTPEAMKVKTVTKRDHNSRNHRDLLGKPKPAVRGAIGSWVRGDEA